MSVPAPTTAQVRPLSNDQQTSFKEHGYVVLRGFVSQQMSAALLAAAQDGLASAVASVELGTDVGYAGASLSREAKGGQTVRRLLNVDSCGMSYTGQARDPRVAAAIAQLIDGLVYPPLTHHDCVMTKHPAFGMATHWHRDSRYWSLERNELVSPWLVLVEETTDNGCLWVIPGSHELDLPADRFDAKLFLCQELPENRTLIDTARPVPLLSGDVLFFHRNTSHVTRASQTAVVKFSVVFTYYSPDNYLLLGTRPSAWPDPLVS